MDNERVGGGGGEPRVQVSFLFVHRAVARYKGTKFQISTENEKVENILGSVL